MTNTLPVCIPCTLAIGKVIRFFPARNGYRVPYGYNTVQSGDLMMCRICGHQIVDGLARSPLEGRGENIRHLTDPAMVNVGDSDVKTHRCVLLDHTGTPLRDGEYFPQEIYIPKTTEALQYVFMVNEGAKYADFGALGVVARSEVCA